METGMQDEIRELQARMARLTAGLERLAATSLDPRARTLSLVCGEARQHAQLWAAAMDIALDEAAEVVACDGAQPPERAADGSPAPRP